MPSLRTRTASHVYLVLDNLSCHAEISHPQVSIMELPLNTTARSQPLENAIIAALKRRYKTRLLGRVVTSLDSLITSGEARPCVPQGGGLDQGGRAHLQFAARIGEEWDKVTPV